MKKIATLLLILLPFNLIHAQITISSADMPSSGDTIRLSETMDIKGNDPALTGANYTWNYANLVPNAQRVDTFFSVGSTPIAYQFYFNNIILYPNHKASFALKGPDIGITQVPITDVFNYVKNSSSAYDNVGFGSNINSIPSSTRNIPVDREYEFPMNYNDNHTSNSEFGITVPSFGHYGQSMERIDTVDGWGSLTTPFGTYNCLRVKSILNKIDTTYLDLLSLGTTIPRPEEIEYKWLANGKGLPVLKIVTIAGNVTQIEYQDSLRLNVSIAEIKNSNKINIYPNPVKNHLNIESKNTVEKIQIFDITGKLVLEPISRLNSIYLNELVRGIYFIKIETENGVAIEKIIKK
ncbi:MAG: T9SS type A sorting domain-containing protein [Vicingaceae bacterium]|nr:T9SS type A sorting domain-containing protein [Vicingaceae bacterium]